MILIGLVLSIAFIIGKMFFVAQYGEQIRQLIINMPEYKPTWFATVGLDNPIRPWQYTRVMFFVFRLWGVFFNKRTSPVNERFKASVPQEIVTFLKVLRYIAFSGLILMGIAAVLVYVFNPFPAN